MIKHTKNNLLAQENAHDLSEKDNNIESKREHSIVYSFWIKHRYINWFLFLIFIFILNFILFTSLINSKNFIPVDINSGIVIFNRVFMILGLLDIMAGVIFAMILLGCMFVKYLKTLRIVSYIFVSLSIIIFISLAYFIWLLVIYNLIIYKIGIMLIVLVVLFLLFLCYNNKHAI